MALPQLLNPPPNSFISHKSPPLNSLNYKTPPSITNNFLFPRRRKPTFLRSTSSSSYSSTVELPLFPLPLVLFPNAVLPLQIFEFRYRILLQTLLQTDLRFGIIYTDSQIGCVAEIIKHESLTDDRFFLICKGQERFRITKILRTKPYLIASVTYIEDKPSSDDTTNLDELSNEVEVHMKDVIRLSNRLNGKDGDKEVGDLRRNMFPTPFSFFVGSTFEGAPKEQQALLELEDTGVRLRREKETLRNTLNYLTAASAVKDVFPSSSSNSNSSSS